jgi:hypothetical protein
LDENGLQTYSRIPSLKYFLLLLGSLAMDVLAISEFARKYRPG